MVRFKQSEIEKRLTEPVVTALFSQYDSLILHGVSVQAHDGVSTEIWVKKWTLHDISFHLL